MTAHQFTPAKRKQPPPPVFLPPARKARRRQTVSFANTLEVILIDQRRSVSDGAKSTSGEPNKIRKNPFDDDSSPGGCVYDSKLGTRTSPPKIRLTREHFFRACELELTEPSGDEIVSQCSGGVWDSCDSPLSDHSLFIPPHQNVLRDTEGLAELTANGDQLGDYEMVSVEKKSACSPNWSTFLVTAFTESQLSLMEYLRSRQWLAYSMQEFCQVYQVAFREDQLTPWEMEKISKLLSVYVVSPLSMPSTFKFRTFDEETRENISDSEIFDQLARLWLMVPGCHVATSFGSEIDSDFWSALCKLAGIRLVAFFLQHCRIYRPFRDTMGAYTPGKWVHLGLGRRWTMYYSWDAIGQKMRRYRESEAPKYGMVSKRTIMYRCLNSARREVELLDEPKFSAELGVTELLSIVIKRLKKHMSLSQGSQRRAVMTNSRANYERINPGTQQKQRHWTPTNTVGSYITGLLREIMPTRLLGSLANHRAFYRAVGKYIKTPAHSSCTTASLSKDIRLREIPWARNLTTEKQQYGIMCVLGWLISNVVHPLLAYHFYITEMSGRPTTLYYFEHEVWEEVFQKQGRDFLVTQFQADGNSVVPLTEENFGDSIAINHEHNAFLGGSSDFTSNISGEANKTPLPPDPASTSASTTNYSSSHDYVQTRYVPKPDGSIRPILNLKSINKHLQAAHHVLHQLIQIEYPRLNRPQDWIAQLYSYRSSFEPGTVFYAVKADLKGCYDNADIASVVEFVTQLIERQPNSLYRVETIRSLNIQKDIIRDRKVVSTLPEKTDDSLFAATCNKKGPGYTNVSGNTEIVSELPTPEVISSSEILGQVHNLLCELPLRISRTEMIKFRKGIPQGSSLSLELCNVLLEEMVNDRLAKFVKDTNSLLLRYVDDFLFVTTHKVTAIDFENTMRCGFIEKYGLICRPDKVLAVLDLQSRTSGPSQMSSLTYLGREIDIQTLDVKPVDLPPLNAHLNCSLKTMKLLRKRLHLDIQKLMEPIRTFQRCERPAPPQLLRATIVMFGKVMAHRMPYYVLARAESRSGRRIRHTETSKDPRQQPVSPKAVMYCLLSRYFGEFIPKAEFSGRLYRPAITRYYQESKRLGPSFVNLTWRTLKAGALVRDLTPPKPKRS